jgi:raffinose/stachyose/melibiose transport system permease protein
VNWIGFDNYDEFLFQGLASRDNIAATVRTLQFCVAVTFIQFTLGLILALVLNQELKGRPSSGRSSSSPSFSAW